MFRHWSNRLSKIDSKKQYWLIFFERPFLETDQEKPLEERWCRRFWVWDSDNSEIVFEEILYENYSENKPENKSPIIGPIGFTYIGQDDGLVIIWAKKYEKLYIADFKCRQVYSRPKRSGVVHSLDLKGSLAFRIFDKGQKILVSFPGGETYVYSMIIPRQKGVSLMDPFYETAWVYNSGKSASLNFDLSDESPIYLKNQEFEMVVFSSAGPMARIMVIGRTFKDGWYHNLVENKFPKASFVKNLKAELSEKALDLEFGYIDLKNKEHKSKLSFSGVLCFPD